MRLSSTVWIFIAFIPWILYWSLSGSGLWTAAVSAALLTSLALTAYRVRQRRPKAIELVTLGFSALHFLATVVLGLPLFKLYDIEAVVICGKLVLILGLRFFMEGVLRSFVLWKGMRLGVGLCYTFCSCARR